MSNGRKVSTDALETLGQIIDDTQRRDAIHLAVLPQIAVGKLFPGQDIGLVEGGAGPADTNLGIVDPFLKATVQPGQRFWMILYPRMVTSLRHVWTHPAFPDAEVSVDTSAKARSEEWLRRFCEQSDCPSYEKTIAAAMDCDEEYLHFDGSDAHGEIPDEFWDNVEIVTGQKVMKRASFFSCSC